MFASATAAYHHDALRARVKQVATAVALAVFIAVLALVAPTPSQAQGSVQVDK